VKRAFNAAALGWLIVVVAWGLASTIRLGSRSAPSSVRRAGGGVLPETGLLAGLAPGRAPEERIDVITPLEAADPTAMVKAPAGRKGTPAEPASRPRSGEAARVAAVIDDRPGMPMPLLLLEHRSDAVVTPLGVRDAAALVMGPNTMDPLPPPPDAPAPDPLFDRKK
jgi:hypothetical protein